MKSHTKTFDPNTENLYGAVCDCGSEMIISEYDLVNGYVTNCGCDGGDYFYCHSKDGTLISSRPIVTCKHQNERN